MNGLNEITKNVICWPREEDLEATIDGFGSIARMDNVVEAIDGTFMHIKAPHKDHEVYKTSKLTLLI